MHTLLSFNLLGNPNASGRLRSIPVSIGKTAYQPVAIPQLIEDHFRKILETADAIEDPFEQSFFVMVHLPYLQPFVDVNKRVSRLAANIPLIKHNYCPISFVNVPKQAYIDGILGVYELNEIDLLADVYVWAYERSTLRYSEARAYLIGPDIFIENYEANIKNVIIRIIREKLSKHDANKAIELWAEENIPEKDRARFIEIVETELLTLHEGNIAKYKIKPEEFNAWQLEWCQGVKS